MSALGEMAHATALMGSMRIITVPAKNDRAVRTALAIDIAGIRNVIARRGILRARRPPKQGRR
jgi:hypothetical protein